MIAVVINIIMAMILSAIVSFEKNHTENDETMGLFKKLVILQFINIAIVILIINMNTRRHQKGSSGESISPQRAFTPF